MNACTQTDTHTHTSKITHTHAHKGTYAFKDRIFHSKLWALHWMILCDTTLFNMTSFFGNRHCTSGLKRINTNAEIRPKWAHRVCLRHHLHRRLTLQSSQEVTQHLPPPPGQVAHPGERKRRRLGWVFPSQRIQSFYVHLQKLNTPSSSLPRSCYWTKQQSSYLFNSEQPNVPLFHLVWSELLYTTQDNFTIGIHQGISSKRTQQSHGDVPNRLWRSILSAGEQKAISDIFT